MLRRIFTLTGPSAIGKTRLANRLRDSFPARFQRVPMFTTRHPREGDEDEYVHVTTEEFDDLEQKGVFLAVTRVPARFEERRYGYRGEDIDGIRNARKIPVAVTDATLLESFLRHFGRSSVFSLGLLPPGKDDEERLAFLRIRLERRGRENDEQIRERLRNAKDDFRLFSARPELFDCLLVHEDFERMVKEFMDMYYFKIFV